MLSYRFDCQQDDGTWSVQEFQSVDDHEAISHGLSIRTANRCELYQADRWLATFDGATGYNDHTASRRTEDTNLNSAWTFQESETEAAYFHHRASKERQKIRTCSSTAAKLAHRTMAEYLESLARVIEAKRRRRNFYDVNAAQGKIQEQSMAGGNRPWERTDGRKICFSVLSAD